MTAPRREIRLLLAEGTALLILGSGIFRLRRWKGRTLKRAFTAAPLDLTQSVAVPVFYMLMGWTLLRVCGVFLGSRPLERRWARPLRRTVFVCLAAWAVLKTPAALWSMWPERKVNAP